MKFRKCGIHTRLQNIIDKSGGYNIFAATEQLMKDYNILHTRWLKMKI